MIREWNNIEELEQLLFYLEGIRTGVMKQINLLGRNDEAVRATTVYPLAKVNLDTIMDIPYMHISYEGMLPHFSEKNKEYLKMIREYYLKSTLDSYDFRKIDYRFKNAVIIFAQYFNNHIIRDLDNRNTKFIQDAIRLTRIIEGDSWEYVWNTNVGFYDPNGSHVQVYVVNRNDFIQFFDYFLKNHHNMKQMKQLNREDFFEEFKKNENEKEIVSRIKITENLKEYF